MNTLNLFLIVVLTAPSWAQASTEFPISRLKGLFTYQNDFQVPNIRRAETIPSETDAGKKRIQELRSQGYSCIRKDPKTRLCSKNWKPVTLPEGFENSVHDFMRPVTVHFEGSETPPRLVHDGSTTQEWDVDEKVQVIKTQVSLYRVVRRHDQQIFIAFPVNQDQPLSPLRYLNREKLSLTVIGNVKDTETSTTAYTIEAFLEKTPGL